MARLQVTEARHRPAPPARERRAGARHALATAVPVGPTIYEVLQVYGPTIKELIHEQFGDEIVSDFRK